MTIYGDNLIISEVGSTVEALLDKKPTKMTSVQRHSTIPMTKRDSLVMNGSRVSLVSNGSNACPCEDKNILNVNTHPDMIAGKKRATPKKVKRTPSYKKATNRQSADDDLSNNLLAYQNDTRRDSSDRLSKQEDRKKYNTLPIELKNAVTTKKSEPKRKRDASKDKNDNFHRNASQKSGTYPSPDTEEDQNATLPGRKKKSRFKRVKERLILTFKKDDEHKKKKKIKHDKHISQGARVRPSFIPEVEGFRTPQDEARGLRASSQAQHDQKHYNDKTFKRGVHTPIEEVDEEQGGALDISHNNKPKHGLIQTIRNSFRRKQAPEKYKTSKKLSPRSSDTSQQHSSTTPDRNHTSSDHTPASQPLSGQPSPSKPSATSTDNHRPHTEPIAIPTRPSITEDIEDDDQFEEEDSITEIFGSIIDPKHTFSRGSSWQGRSSAAPDRASLKLEGLNICRPRSFDKKTPRDSPVPVDVHHFTNSHHGDLSPTVEIDGLDFADAPPILGACAGFHEEEGLQYTDVSNEAKQRQIDDVASRLAAIGDRLVAEKEAGSGSGSEVEGHYVGGGRRQSKAEREIMLELRKFADENFGTRDGININLSTSICPIIKSILTAQNYSSFSRVIDQGLSDTIGWEQVAWYTFLIKSTVLVVGAGQKVGQLVTNRAKRYFSSKIRPWVETRPNGWESIYEETDVESELD